MTPEIKQAAYQLGFNLVYITSAAPLEEDAARFQSWCEAGFAGDMAYMTRNTALNSAPNQLFPSARSIISLGTNYYEAAARFEQNGRRGRVARYAWGRDYHNCIKERLKELHREIERIVGREVKARIFVDAVPLLERAIGQRAGLGFFGKNTNLLTRSYGSWFFISEILVDLDLAPDQPAQGSCGKCVRCLDDCPTAAIVAPFQVDSRLCISYLTIENKGAIPIELREKIGDWVFGCDVCQDVCPFTRFAKETNWDQLKPHTGVGPALDLIETLSIKTDAEFRQRFHATALLRPKRRGLLRNAAVVAANIHCEEAIPVLIDLATGDAEPLIRGHSVWALARLGGHSVKAILEKVAKWDEDESVRREALHGLETELDAD